MHIPSHLFIACIQFKENTNILCHVILPVWQIPFDSPYFVPLALQNSWGPHTAVSLHKPVIFINVLNKYKQQVIIWGVFWYTAYEKSYRIDTVLQYDSWNSCNWKELHFLCKFHHFYMAVLHKDLKQENGFKPEYG